MCACACERGGGEHAHDHHYYHPPTLPPPPHPTHTDINRASVSKFTCPDGGEDGRAEEWGVGAGPDHYLELGLGLGLGLKLGISTT